MCPRTPFIFPRPVLNPSIHKPQNHYILVQDLALNPSWFLGPAQVYSLRPYSLELILKRPSTCPMCTRPTWLGPSCKWDRLPYRAIEVHRDVSVQPYSGWREKVYLTPGCLAVLLVSGSQHSLILLQSSFICCADQIDNLNVTFHQ